MTTQTPLSYLATIGPLERPEAKIRVNVLRQTETPGFFLCQDTTGTLRVLHESSLKLIWHHDIPTPQV